MPTYEFHDTETGEQWEDIMKYEEYKQFLEDNPHIRPVYTINMISGAGDKIKTDSGFNDMLGRIAAANPTSPLADKHGSKGIKESKTRAAVNKFKRNSSQT